MKAIKTIMVILSIPSLVWGMRLSANKKHEIKKPVSITIYFKNNPGIDALDTYLWDVQNLQDYQRVYTSRVVHGYNRFQAIINHPVNIGFEADTLSLYHTSEGHSMSRGFIVEPGDNLHLAVGDNLKLGILNIVFTGKGASKYRCIQELISTVNGKKRKWGYYLNVDELFARADSDRVSIKQIMRKYKHSLSHEAFQIIELEYLNNAYLPAFGRLLHSKDGGESLNRYAKIIHDLKEIFTTQTACYSHNNLVLLNNLAILNSRIKERNDTNADFLGLHFVKHYQLLKSAYRSNSVVSEILLASAISDSISATGLNKYLRESIDDFLMLANRSSTLYTQVLSLKKIYEKRFAEGGNAFDFALPDTNGKIIRQRDLKGKVVILDFFFTGCVGCYTTAPVLDSLERVYKSRDIVFVSVGVDKTAASWKKGIGMFSSKNAIQVFTQGLASNHPMIKFYRVSSYPTIVIVGKDGKLISAHAPDPRTEAGGKAFTSVLERSL